MRYISYTLICATICAVGMLSAPAIASASEAQYGAGFWASPSVESHNEDTPLHANRDNYGAGFWASPSVSNNSIADAAVSTGNYGQGFIASPNLYYSTQHYGAGFRSFRFGWWW